MPRTSWTPLVNRWFATHHGIITLQIANGFGCPQSSVSRLVAAGEWLTVMPGVYRSGAHPDSSLGRMTAVCLRNPLVAVGFTSACRLWSLRKVLDDNALHLLVPHGSSPELRSPELRNVVIHRCRQIDAVDIVERDDGIRVTSPPRSIFDSADMLGVKRCASALEQVLDQYCNLSTVVETLSRLGRPRRPGTTTMKRVLRDRPAWQAAVQSDLELTVLHEIRAQGLLEPLTQHDLTLPTGKRIRFDFAWPDQQVALEIDHPFWHSFSDAVHLDKGRDRAAATIGWLTLRVTDLDVTGPLPAAIAQVSQVLASRSPAG